ncbi:MAG: hypothetical protein JJE30_10410 [Desulfuromonadales bacterium]|nr:hypothetical protein [Desulfuromonadales bacterium]
MPDTDKIIKVCPLGGGIQATVTDATSHYFGGYYHVRIRVSADVPVSAAAFSVPADYQDAITRLGSSVRLYRTLEKMAVPEGEIDSVRRHLLESFDANVLPYLLRDDFADSFVLSEYRKALKQRAPFQRYHL